MASQKPLVIIAGQIQQLPTGDTLAAAAQEVDVFAKLNANAGAIVIGTPVYASSATQVDKAGAAAAATSRVVGLMQSVSTGSGVSGFIQKDGVLTATTGQWDAVAGTTGGLAFGTLYYLSGTAGLLTATAPTASGSYVLCMGTALSTTELEINFSAMSVLLS